MRSMFKHGSCYVFQKKKTKQKHESEPEFLAVTPSVSNFPIQIEQVSSLESPHTSLLTEPHNKEMESGNIPEKDINLEPQGLCTRDETSVHIEIESSKSVLKDNNVKTQTLTQLQSDLNLKLESICIPGTPDSLTIERAMSIEKGSAYKEEVTTEAVLDATVVSAEVSDPVDIAPSAPMLDFSEPPMVYPEQVTVHEVPKLISMPLEEAIRIYGGKEMAEVMAMSEREEAIVEAGDMSGPDHPLVDFLSTFKYVSVDIC